MKRKSVFLIVGLMGLFSWGFNSQAAFKHSLTLANKDFTSERIPLTLEGDTPIATMEIGGKKVRLIVDTGANSVTVTIKTAVLGTIDVQYLDSYETSMVVSGEITRAQRIIIPSANLGGLKFSKLTATEERRNFIDSDGLIGNELLKNFYVLFDYSASQLVLYSKAAYPDELNLSNWARIPFYHNNIGIIVNGRLGEKGKKLKFCLDSGCTIKYQEKRLGIIRSKDVPPAERENGVRIGLNQSKESDYSTTKTEQFYLGDFNLGPLAFLVYDLQQLQVDGFIGGNVFSNYKIFIDFDHQVLFFNKIAA